MSTSFRDKVTVYIFRIGDYWETADITRVFSSFEKALECIPVGFEQVDVGGYDYYAQDDRKNRWLSIKGYKVK